MLLPLRTTTIHHALRSIFKTTARNIESNTHDIYLHFCLHKRILNIVGKALLGSLAWYGRIVCSMSSQSNTCGALVHSVMCSVWQFAHNEYMYVGMECWGWAQRSRHCASLWWHTGRYATTSSTVTVRNVQPCADSSMKTTVVVRRVRREHSWNHEITTETNVKNLNKVN